MKNFDHHCQKMLDLLRDYATDVGIAPMMSGLIIFREVGAPEPDQPKLRMQIMGEPPDMALVTLTQASTVVAAQLNQQQPPAPGKAE